MSTRSHIRMYGYRLSHKVAALGLALVCAAFALDKSMAWAQTPPTKIEKRAYQGLHAAAAKDDAIWIRLLAKRGADLNKKDDAGRTPIHVAVYLSHLNAFRALAAAGADTTIADRRGMTPLQRAKQKGFHAIAASFPKSAASPKKVAQ